MSDEKREKLISAIQNLNGELAAKSAASDAQDAPGGTNDADSVSDPSGADESAVEGKDGGVEGKGEGEGEGEGEGKGEGAPRKGEEAPRKGEEAPRKGWTAVKAAEKKISEERKMLQEKQKELETLMRLAKEDPVEFVEKHGTPAEKWLSNTRKELGLPDDAPAKTQPAVDTKSAEYQQNARIIESYSLQARTILDVIPEKFENVNKVAKLRGIPAEQLVTTYWAQDGVTNGSNLTPKEAALALEDECSTFLSELGLAKAGKQEESQEKTKKAGKTLSSKLDSTKRSDSSRKLDINEKRKRLEGQVNKILRS